MRIRKMRSTDLPGVISVYNARARTTIGFVKRSRESWRKMRVAKWAKKYWIVAVDGGRIAGFGMGYVMEKTCHVGDVVWHPDYDGTDTGSGLLNALIRHMKHLKPSSITMWGTGDSLTLRLPRSSEFSSMDIGHLLMAAVTDTNLLLRDAKKVIEKRVQGRLRLFVEGRNITIGRGRDSPLEITTDANTLLALIFGTKELSKELRNGNVRVSSKKNRARRLLREAFPDRKLWIEDTW